MITQLLIEPADLLFFRDGRPMGGSLAGHGAEWPLPHTLFRALHVALHRFAPDSANFPDVQTAGPFPVDAAGRWFFPRPADTVPSSEVRLGRQPAAGDWSRSSLPKPLRYAVAALQGQGKPTAFCSWWSGDAWRSYIAGDATPLDDSHFAEPSSFGLAESAIGIAIDGETQTTGRGDTEGRIYSSHSLRLRDGVRLGGYAGATGRNETRSAAAVWRQFSERSSEILLGGQQHAARVNVASCAPALPQGKAEFQPQADGKCRVKWVLLSPAIWPAIAVSAEKGVPAHPGGWLPTWVDATGVVRLTDGPGRNRAIRRRVPAGGEIKASVVAALVPKPIVVTGWTSGAGARQPGAMSTHLAAPAGSVYYFECDTPAAAAALARALNWHGDLASPLGQRRSNVGGTHGFGLGVCAEWQLSN